MAEEVKGKTKEKGAKAAGTFVKEYKAANGSTYRIVVDAAGQFSVEGRNFKQYERLDALQNAIEESHKQAARPAVNIRFVQAERPDVVMVCTRIKSEGYYSSRYIVIPEDRLKKAEADKAEGKLRPRFGRKDPAYESWSGYQFNRSMAPLSAEDLAHLKSLQQLLRDTQESINRFVEKHGINVPEAAKAAEKKALEAKEAKAAKTS